jgi:hypothetical protein
MNRTLLVASLALAAGITSAFAGAEIKVFAVPRSARIPPSGKVLVDLFVMNGSARSIERPAEETVSALYRVFSRDGKTAPRIAGNVMSSLHRKETVRIPSKVTRQTTEVITVDALPNEIVVVEISLGQRTNALRANSFVLYK